MFTSSSTILSKHIFTNIISHCLKGYNTERKNTATLKYTSLIGEKRIVTAIATQYTAGSSMWGAPPVSLKLPSQNQCILVKQDVRKILKAISKNHQLLATLSSC